MEQWVLDASMEPMTPDGPFCYCPIEGDIDGDFEVVVGFTSVGSIPRGRCVAIWHPDGQEAVEDFCRRYAAALEAEGERLRGTNGGGE